MSRTFSLRSIECAYHGPRRFPSRRFGPLGGYALGVLLLLSVPVALHAQYYEEREYAPTEARYVYAGLARPDFLPRSSNPLPDSVAVSFRGLMPMIGFRQGPVDISVGYMTYSLRGMSRSATFLNATVMQELPLTRGGAGALVLPVVLAADYTRAETIGFERDNFNIASLGLGLGLKYRYQRRDLDLSLHMLGVAHYSSEGFSTGTGFSSAALAEALVLLPEAIIGNGIVFGYRFRLQNWSMSNDKFNYRLISHGASVGIMF
jgi:hypothetical protein